MAQTEEELAQAIAESIIIKRDIHRFAQTLLSFGWDKSRVEKAVTESVTKALPLMFSD